MLEDDFFLKFFGIHTHTHMCICVCVQMLSINNRTNDTVNCPNPNMSCLLFKATMYVFALRLEKAWA